MEQRPGRLTRLFTKTIVAATFGLSLTTLDFLWSQEKTAQPKDHDGLILNGPTDFNGYTLFSPLNSTKTFLIDMQRKVVKTWQGASTPCGYGQLLPNGNLLRPCHPAEKKQTIVPGTTGPNGGRIQEFTWDGELV